MLAHVHMSEIQKGYMRVICHSLTRALNSDVQNNIQNHNSHKRCIRLKLQEYLMTASQTRFDTVSPDQVMACC
jgi:hypothetical protein